MFHHTLDSDGIKGGKAFSVILPHLSGSVCLHEARYPPRPHLPQIGKIRMEANKTCSLSRARDETRLQLRETATSKPTTCSCPAVSKMQKRKRVEPTPSRLSARLEPRWRQKNNCTCDNSPHGWDQLRFV